MVKYLIFLLFLPMTALAQQVDPDDMRLYLQFEDLPETPYQEEMVLLTLRGEYRVNIALEKLHAAELDGFSWMQLGRDEWSEETIDGLPTRVFERRMALFPQQVGRLEVSGFRHEFTLLTPTGDRFPYEVTSDAITLDVLEAPRDGNWWLPLREIQVEDRWSNPIDKLEVGEGALRIVTVTGVGVSPDMMPPMPELTAPSAFIFPHPERRIVDLTPQGPVSRVFWRWTVRPDGNPSAIINPLEIHYFDTKTREAKTITLATQKMAVATNALAIPATARAAAEPSWCVPFWLPLFGGMLGGLLLLGGDLRARGRIGITELSQKLGLDKRSRALRRDVRNGDTAAIYRMLKLHLRGNKHQEAETLEKSLYAPDAPTVPRETLKHLSKTTPARP